MKSAIFEVDHLHVLAENPDLFFFDGFDDY